MFKILRKEGREINRKYLIDILLRVEEMWESKEKY